jgi:aspartate aminotransferase
LNSIDGIRCLLAEGAFYLFPNIAGFGIDDIDFCDRLLDEKKVAAVPGSAFGAPGFIRISYATSDAVLAKGLDRLGQFCRSL